ncbi:hypothetical protein F5B19DRAFT_504749 [Rostrohypoxylon terebratum]|nr:hypothetical protein F5B19DRAFT_504749 [Rostrohypoxylon terebratum]
MSTHENDKNAWNTPGSSTPAAGRPQRESVPWVKGMKLGPGAPHGFNFQKRINESDFYSGAGTVADPKVMWVIPCVNKKTDEEKEKLTAQGIVIRDLAKDYGLSHAWISSEPHNYSTTMWVNGERHIEFDDYHVTLRLGKSDKVCNLHGHAYFLYEDNDPGREVMRAMLDDERSIKGGENPQLWIWGKYPPESKDWPRTKVEYPSSPLEVIKDSILSKQLKGTSWPNDKKVEKAP